MESQPVGQFIECVHHVSGGPTFKLSQAMRQPQAFIQAYINSAKSVSSYDNQTFFNYRFQLQTETGPTVLHPRYSQFPSNDWTALAALLEGFGMSAFCEARREDRANVSPRLQGFSNTWSVESGNGERQFVCRRRTLVSQDKIISAWYRHLATKAIDLENLPAIVREQWLPQLSAHTQEVVFSFPLYPFLEEVKLLLEEAICLHYYLFVNVIDIILRRFDKSGIYLHPQEIIPYHLVPQSAVRILREDLYNHVCRRYPAFKPHALFEGATLTHIEEEKRRAQLGVGSPVVKQEFKSERHFEVYLHPSTCTLVAKPENPELEKLLRFIDSELAFEHFAVKEGFSIASKLCAEVAAAIAMKVSELEGSWSEMPTAFEVDKDDFWRKDFRKFHDGGGSSSTSMNCLRYALYDPPYGSISQTVFASLDDHIFQQVFGTVHPASEYTVFSVTTKDSSFFINEWWDYLWVAAHLSRPEVIVIYGTATD